MVHHKVHDSAWTGIPLLPSNDDKPRELHRPSTAATLNFAAVACRARSRYLARFDKPYVDEAAAPRPSKAYAAVKAQPGDLRAGGRRQLPAADPTTTPSVSDEFYWAAGELFITHRRSGLSRRPARPRRIGTGDVFSPAGFRLEGVAGFARLHAWPREPNRFEAATQRAIRQSVLDGADAFLALQAEATLRPDLFAGCRVRRLGLEPPRDPERHRAGHAPTTSQPARSTGTARSRRWTTSSAATRSTPATSPAMATCMRTTSISRWSRQTRSTPTCPSRPEGSLAGGPNSSIQDPVVQALFGERRLRPQLCYIDDIQAWSVNEITINWNAALKPDGRLAGHAMTPPVSCKGGELGRSTRSRPEPGPSGSWREQNKGALGTPRFVCCKNLTSDSREAHFSGAGLHNAELRRSGLAEVDDPAPMIGPAVIDFHRHRLSRLLVGHLEFGAEGQCLVRSGHGVLIIGLARGSLSAVEPRTVPGRGTALVTCREGLSCHEGKTTRHKGSGDNDVLDQLLLDSR